MSKIKTLKDLVEKLNVHESFFLPYAINNEKKIVSANNHNRLVKLLYGDTNRKVILRCVECDHEHAFYIKTDIFNYSKTHPTDKNIIHFLVIEGTMMFSRELKLKNEIQNDAIVGHYYVNVFFVEYIFTCTNDESHNQKVMLKVIVDDNKGLEIIKIGQDPINIMLVQDEIKEYNKQLKEFDVIQDYSDLISSKYKNLYAGAATYLRRIYEKIVDYYIKKNNLKIVEDERMEDRVKKISNYLDEDFKKMSKNIYDLLSVSIHKMTNEEIMKFYDFLNKSILFQLHHQKQIDEGIKKKKQIRDQVSNFATNIKSKQVK